MISPSKSAYTIVNSAYTIVKSTDTIVTVHIIALDKPKKRYRKYKQFSKKREVDSTATENTLGSIRRLISNISEKSENNTLYRILLAKRELIVLN